jgi:hypothetical protein
MPDPSHRCSILAQNHHDAFFELHPNPLMRESRGRRRHTLGREHETPRNIQRRQEYEGERERGQSRPCGEDPEGPGGRNPYTPCTYACSHYPVTWEYMGFFLLDLQGPPHMGGIVPFPSPPHTPCILETQTYVLVMRSLGDHVFPIVGY